MSSFIRSKDENPQDDSLKLFETDAVVEEHQHDAF